MDPADTLYMPGRGVDPAPALVVVSLFGSPPPASNLASVLLRDEEGVGRGVVAPWM